MKIKLLLLLFLPLTFLAQFTVTPNPFNVNSGAITITYGPNYALFDPQLDPNLYLYTGLETDGNATTWDYHDDWSNLATHIPLTYNASLGYYVATVNIGNRSYLKEPALTFGPIDAGTFVNNWYFLIRRVSPTAQSADLIGTNYGFQPLALLTNEQFIKLDEVYVSNGNLISTQSEKLQVSIYSVLGQKVKEFSIQNESIPLQLNEKGMFIAKISNSKTTKKIKFLN